MPRPAGRYDRRMLHILKQIKPAKMRRPEVALVKAHGCQPHRIAHHIPGLARQFDHLGNQHIVEPAVRLAFEPRDLFSQLFCIFDRARRGIGFNLDPPDVEQTPRG